MSSGVMFSMCAGHLIDHLLHQLLFELLHQLIEALLGLLRLEVVRVEFADLAGQIVGHQVEAHVALVGSGLGVLGSTLVAGVLGVTSGIVDGVAFLVDDVVELSFDLVVDATEVGVLQALLTLGPELFEQLAQALHLLAVAVGEALLHHSSQGSVDIAVIQQFVGEFVERRVGVELETGLGAIPAGVLEPLRHVWNVTGPPPLRCSEPVS